MPTQARTCSIQSAYATLRAADAHTPVAAIREVLLWRLTQTTRAARVRLWLADPDGTGRLRTGDCWPPDESAIPEIADPTELEQHPDVNAAVMLREGDRVLAALTVTTYRRFGRRRRRELSDTANCLMVLHRREELQTRLHRQLSYTTHLAGEVLDSSRRVAGVRELERRRVTAKVVSFSSDRLAPLRAGVDRLIRRPELTGELEQLRDGLGELVTDFRALVRGIHPEVLYRQGLRAALTELAAAHPDPACVSGTVPARVDPEVAASLYYLTATSFHALARSGAHLELALGQRATGLKVELLVRTPPDTMGAAELRTVLALDTDRLTALGGSVHVQGMPGEIRIEAWVPERLEPVSRAELLPPSSFYARVRALALGMVARYAEAPGSARARRLVGRLDEPVHVAVVGSSGAGRRAHRVVESLRRRPDLVLLTFDVPADVHGSPTGDPPPDVIVRPSSAGSPDNFDVLLPGADAPLFAHVCWWQLLQVLTTGVVAQSDLLRARTALGAMFRLTRTTPPPAARSGSLERDLQELRADADGLQIWTELPDGDAETAALS